jgi:hypothetical protein
VLAGKIAIEYYENGAAVPTREKQLKADDVFITPPKISGTILQNAFGKIPLSTFLIAS